MDQSTNPVAHGNFLTRAYGICLGGGAADSLEARKVPSVREIATLLRFGRLDRAVASIEENALSVRLVLKSKTATIGAQPGVALNEVKLRDSEKCGEARDLFLAQFHLPGPAAALRAANPLIMNRHGQSIAETPAKRRE